MFAHTLQRKFPAGPYSFQSIDKRVQLTEFFVT